MSKYYTEHDTSKFRYVIYARKSTEAEDRQVASIQDQVDVMSDVAKELKLEIVDIISEASSAYHQGRKAFNVMIDRLRNKEIDGILVWKLSRLARNPEDAGIIQGMLQRKEIVHIRTVDRNWWPEDNVLSMAVEMAQSNQFSRDLSSDTKRGLMKKAERGWCPKTALPLGYVHSPYKKLGELEIEKDPERFDVIAKALKKVAVGELRPPQAYSYAIDLGLKTKKGKPISESVFYRILVNPFYYGRFEFPEGSCNWFEGKHAKAISQEEFDLIQRYKGRKDAPRPQKHLFPYTGMMKCGECGCSIVVDPKVKVQKNGNVHEYYYYRCTKQRGPCNQKYLEVTELETQLSEMLASIKLPDSFHEWAISELEQDSSREIEDRTEILKVAKAGYDEAVSQLNELVKLYLAKKVPEEAYTATIASLQKDKNKYKKILDNTDQRIDEWILRTKKAVEFAHDAKNRFDKSEDLTEKNDILLNLGANVVIKDLTLSIEIDKPLEIVREGKQKFEQVLKTFEPQTRSLSGKEMQVFLAKNTIMGG